jgi:hypothetical protein
MIVAAGIAETAGFGDSYPIFLRKQTPPIVSETHGELFAPLMSLGPEYMSKTSSSNLHLHVLYRVDNCRYLFQTSTKTLVESENKYCIYQTLEIANLEEIHAEPYRGLQEIIYM